MAYQAFFQLCVYFLLLNAAVVFIGWGENPAFFAADTLFGVRLGPTDFHSRGEPARRAYWKWLITQFVVIEAFVIVFPVITGNLGFGVYLQTAATLPTVGIAIALYSHYQQTLRAFELPEEAEPAAFSLSLQARSLAAYTHGWFEAAVAVIVLGGLAALVARYPAMPSQFPLRIDSRGDLPPEWIDKSVSLVFAAPVFLALFIFGTLLRKRSVIEGPMKLPARAGLYLKYYQEKLHLEAAFFDLFRLWLLMGFIAAASAFIFAGPAESPIVGVSRFSISSLAGWLVNLAFIGAYAYYLRRSNALNRKLASFTIPESQRAAIDRSRLILGGLFYYDPDNPAVLIDRPRRLLPLNAANKWTWINLISALILAGPIVWVVVEIWPLAIYLTPAK